MARKIVEKLHKEPKAYEIELANTKSDVRWKKIGRFRIFWKEGEK